MEHLLNEQIQANKKIPKNVKYNEAFEVAKSCADHLKNTSNKVFKLYLDAFKEFSRQLRDSMAVEVLEFLSDPSKFELKRKEQQQEPSDENLHKTNEIS